MEATMAEELEFELNLEQLEDVAGGALPILVVAALEGAAVGAVAGAVKWAIDRIF